MRRFHRGESEEKTGRLWHSETAFALGVTLLFLCLGGFGIAHHEMWRDEMQAWLLARDSISLGDLFHNMRYEGHPALWHLGLYALSRFTHNPLAMQVYHLLLAAGVIFLFTRYAPFPRPLRALFSFGYFPFYEYALISRNYALGILLLFAVCALLPTRARRCWPIALLLLLLCNANAYALMIAVALLAALAVEQWHNFDQPRLTRARKCDLALSLGICLAGIAVSAFQIVPPHDVVLAAKGEAQHSSLIYDFGLAFVRSYVPIPHRFHGFPSRFWESNLLADSFLACGPCLVLMGAGLLACSVMALGKCRLGLLWFLFGTFEMLLFMHFGYPASLHHLGHVFLLFVACFWVGQAEFAVFAPVAAALDHGANTAAFRKNTRQFVTLIFACQAVAGVYAYVVDCEYPFSAARQAAAVVAARGPDQFLIGGPDFLASPLCGYLDCRMYYPQSGTYGSFIVWNGRRKAISQKALMERADAEVLRRRKDALLVLSRPLAVSAPEARYVGRSQEAMLTPETYFFYELPYRSVVRAASPSSPLQADGEARLSRSARSAYGGRTLGL